MVELARTTRFSLNPASERIEGPRHNTYAGWPGMVGLGAYYELTVCCRGETDGRTGYLINIADVDEAVRQHVLPLIHAEMRDRPLTEPKTLLPAMCAALVDNLGAIVHSIEWRLTPFSRISIERTDMSRVQMTQSFDFSAAHRLHCDDLSEQHNRELFGKCNNPSGHGHNYKLDVTVAVAATGDGSADTFGLTDLERIVDETVIRRFDHMHLNQDREEFASVNPSVENIARICHDLLDEPVEQAGAELKEVTVWETDRTRSTYPV